MSPLTERRQISIDYEDMPPATLAMALHGLIATEGLADDVERLAKASSDPRAVLPSEPWQLALVRGLEATWRERILPDLRGNVARWVGSAVPVGKAARWIGLTGAQVDELRRLIESHFRVMVSGEPVRWGIPPDAWRRWQRDGIVLRGVPVPQIRDAWVAGRLYQVIESGSSFRAMKAAARGLPLTRPMELAARWAERHAAEYVGRVGARLGERMSRAAAEVQGRQLRTTISRYIADRASDDAGKLIGDWRGLARELGRIAGDAESKRDWLRVATCEVRLASNVGRLEAMAEQRVAGVWWLVQGTACDGCRELFLEADGTPIIFPLREVMGNLGEGGALNVGRTAGMIGDEDEGWRPTGLTHPWCRCVPMPAVEGATPIRVPRVSRAPRRGSRRLPGRPPMMARLARAEQLALDLGKPRGEEP